MAASDCALGYSFPLEVPCPAFLSVAALHRRSSSQSCLNSPAPHHMPPYDPRPATVAHVMSHDATTHAALPLPRAGYVRRTTARFIPDLGPDAPTLVRPERPQPKKPINPMQFP